MLLPLAGGLRSGKDFHPPYTFFDFHTKEALSPAQHPGSGKPPLPIFILSLGELQLPGPHNGSGRTACCFMLAFHEWRHGQILLDLTLGQGGAGFFVSLFLDPPPSFFFFARLLLTNVLLPGSSAPLPTPAFVLRCPGFNLRLSLECSYVERTEHEAQGSYLDDSDVEVVSDSEQVSGGEDEPASHVSGSRSPGPAPTGKRKKNKRGTERFRTKRREEAAKREANHGIKEVALRHAQNAEGLLLSSFDARSLPAASTGWSGSTSKHASTADFQEHWEDLEKLLKDGGMQYVEWDGR